MVQILHTVNDMRSIECAHIRAGGIGVNLGIGISRIDTRRSGPKLIIAGIGRNEHRVEGNVAVYSGETGEARVIPPVIVDIVILREDYARIEVNNAGVRIVGDYIIDGGEI